MKKLISLLLTGALIFSISSMSAFAAEPPVAAEPRTGTATFEITPYATNYYSRGLPVFNIATAGYSNRATVTQGNTLPAGARITKVTVTGRGSASTWCVMHGNGTKVSKSYAASTTFTNFNGLTPVGTWLVWVEGGAWSTVTGQTFRVDYQY